MNRIPYASDWLNFLNVRDALFNGSIELIYLDLPFNTSRDFAAPIGSEAASVAA